MRKNIFKINITTAIFASFVILLSGCSGDDGKKEDLSQNSKVATSSGIEVVKNENAKEIKIEEKEKTNDKSSSYYYDYGVKSKYALNSTPANDDASVRERPRTAVDANLNVRSH